MFVPDDHLASRIFDYCRWRLSLDPVDLDFPGEKAVLEEALDGLIGPDPCAAETVLRVFDETLAPAVISCDSPRFLAFIPAAPTKAALLFDMVVSCSSLQGTSWLEASGAVAAENQVLRFLADLAGLPAGAGGCFVSGGSAANLSALVVAREVGRRRLEGGTHSRSLPPSGRIPDRLGTLRLAVSEQAHSSVSKALMVLGMEALVVATEDNRLTGDALDAALRDDREPESVVGVVATAGTTNAGIVDDLESVGKVANERGLWFHVDGAYGLAALFSESARRLFTGIERADSFVVDPHKWLFAPFDCAALVYRQPYLARAVHTQDASYLEVIHESPSEEWNPSDYAYHLTRRARGLPLWFSLAVNGTRAYSDAIESSLHLARETADLIGTKPFLRLLRQPELSVVLFRRNGWSKPEYDEWSRKLVMDQVGFVTATRWEGESAARLAFLHPNTTLEVVDEILESMR